MAAGDPGVAEVNVRLDPNFTFGASAMAFTAGVY
jgi:hypothetical protein